MKAFLITLSYVNSFHDECLFIKKQYEKIIGLLCLWVDDLLVCGISESFCDWFQAEVSKKFKISDYSDLTWFLGIKFMRTLQKIKVTQEKCIEKVLETFKMNDCRPIGTPLEENFKISKNDCPQEGSEEQLRMRKTNFRSWIGCLNYLALSSRPDICFAAIALSSFVESPGEVHWKSDKRILRYLRETMNQTLTFREIQNLDLLNFSDADWAGNIDNRRSTSGFCFKLSESSGAVSWGCKAQKTVATSTAEAEFNSVVEASKKAIHKWNHEVEPSSSGILEDLGYYL